MEISSSVVASMANVAQGAATFAIVCSEIEIAKKPKVLHLPAGVSALLRYHRTSPLRG